MNNAVFWENIFSNKEWGKYPSENLIRFIARNLFKDESFNAWIDSYSLAYNDFKKPEHIFNKTILKLKPNGKFFSSATIKNIIKYNKNKEDFQLSNHGICTCVRMMLFLNKKDI
ncbi:hypothetical protein [Campylobacter coli]|uniref:hypothetical protein n=1 Tax=Campylobacter coli TaxID=195 RepID=UPI000930CEDF